MKRIHLDYLNDILDAINEIESFTKGMDYKKFVSESRELLVGKKK